MNYYRCQEILITPLQRASICKESTEQYLIYEQSGGWPFWYFLDVKKEIISPFSNSIEIEVLLISSVSQRFE